MADDLFRLQIVTPEKLFFDEPVRMIKFSSSEGEMGVLKGHISLTTMLDSGVATIRTETEDKTAVIHKGFAKIDKDEVIILTDSAEWPWNIDLERAKEAEERARKHLSSSEDNIEYARAEAALMRALARIQGSQYK